MNNFGFNSTVSTQEADALKEMIFRRAKERAQALAEDVQSNYTSAMQKDIMDLARDSFVSTKNPFIVKDEPEQELQTKSEPKTDSDVEGIGFAKRQVNEIKTKIKSENKNINTNISNKEVESAMENARMDFSKRQGFIGALDFLNSQASIALVKNKGKAFEALA